MKKTTSTDNRTISISAVAHAKTKKLAKKNKVTVREWVEKALKSYKPTN